MASLKSPLLAILKSRRVREELGRQQEGKENENENNHLPGHQQGKEALAAKKGKMSKTGGDHNAAGDGVSACETPPDFTPRRRRLRKMGKQALQKFQQRKPKPVEVALAQKLKYEDSEDESAEDDRAAEVDSAAAEEEKTNSDLDDILQGFGGLGIKEEEEASVVVSPKSSGATKEKKKTPDRAKIRVGAESDRISSEVKAKNEGGDLIELDGGYRLQLTFPLFPHQVGGIKWLWKLHRMNKGGILADDMGLGKTMQISAFFSGLFSQKMAKRALIVAPKTLLKHWIKELTKCGLGNYICEFYGGSANARIHDLEEALQVGGIVLTTYGMVLHNSAELRGLGKVRCIELDDNDGSKQVTWDYMILDEGHKVKNPKMQLSKRLKEFSVKSRIIVTGTPLQNNLQELHALMDFVCEDILGDRKSFRECFENPITNGLDKAANHREREIGKATSAKLQNIISQYILRREKEKVFKKQDPAEGGSDTESAAETKDGALPTLDGVRKNDLVVWLKLNRNQQNFYMTFLKTESVFAALNNTRSPLAALTVLKKICDHTHLLTDNAVSQILDQSKLSSSSQKAEDEVSSNATEEKELSCKIDFILELLPELQSQGHRTLLFSQSRQMLDKLEKAVRGLGLDFCRIDGSISSIDKRQQEVDRFKSDSSIPVFLLTTGVGGLGLTLTEADRVIVVDPAWNPSVDNQSVDRAYRIGQTRNVVIYRLITCGTVEEKIYRKQVFKKGLSIVSNGDEEAFRYFTKQDLRELFEASYEGFGRSKTQAELEKMHGKERVSDENLDNHLQFLNKLESFYGISDHDLLFTKAPDQATFHAPYQRGGKGTKFGSKGNSVPQSPLAKKMQSRSQWEGAGLLSHLTIDDGSYRNRKEGEGPSTSTIARIDTVDINHLTSEREQKTDSMKEIQSLRESIARTESILSNETLISRLPDRGEQLRKKKRDSVEKLNSLLEKSYTSPKSSYSMYKEAYKSYKACHQDQSQSHEK